MVTKTFDEVSDVVEQHSGLARVVLEYTLTMKRIVDAAKRPTFSPEDWAPLTRMVAVEEFERVGNFKEVMSWSQYTALLTTWATTSRWECSFKRVTEHEGVVFLELEERSGDGGDPTNSISVYEFDDAGKIRHLDIYLQRAVPAALTQVGATS